jgi:hypothetical protein
LSLVLSPGDERVESIAFPPKYGATRCNWRRI